MGIGVSKHFSIFQRLQIALATRTVEYLDKRTLIGKSLWAILLIYLNSSDKHQSLVKPSLKQKKTKPNRYFFRFPLKSLISVDKNYRCWPMKSSQRCLCIKVSVRNLSLTLLRNILFVSFFFEKWFISNMKMHSNWKYSCHENAKWKTCFAL